MYVYRNFDEDSIFAESFHDTVFLSDNPPWSPIAAYIDESGDKPHAMLTTRHDIDGTEDILRREALAITAAMITRLKAFSTKEHVYIPVSILSDSCFFYFLLTNF